MKERVYSGTKNPVITDRELARRDITRKAAAEGIVLLKNEGILPLDRKQGVVLYGNGAVHAIKGGTGSGDVNSWDEISIYQGLVSAGISLLNEAAVVDAIRSYKEARISWRDKLLDMQRESGKPFFMIYNDNPFKMPAGIPINKQEAASAGAAIYVISRASGEGYDRTNTRGDYELSEKEVVELNELAAYSDRIVILINAGGQIDLNDLLSIPSVKAILNISQGGMELGHAVADILTGAKAPCGKLAQSWAHHYSDFPGEKDFYPQDKKQTDVFYEEGIYVGYRFFDSFGVKPLYPFGYGLSYTDFRMDGKGVTTDGVSISVTAAITNIGTQYAGKEVVQIYAACPQTGLKKEFKRLIGFGKTKELQPGQTQTLTITIPAEAVTSYDPERKAFVAEKGEYAVFIGNSSENISLVGVLKAEETTVLKKVHELTHPPKNLNELERPEDVIQILTEKWKGEATAKGIVSVPFVPSVNDMSKSAENPNAEKAAEIAENITDSELSHFLLGEISKGQDNLKKDVLVDTGIYIPGSAGETSNVLEKYGVPGIPMADGPAGLRLLQTYRVDKNTGLIYGESLDMALVESGLFCGISNLENTETWYQFTTAIPVGTMLAQTFDPLLLEEIGKMLGEELQQFHTAWLLGPGMNIQRNPLCGRNYEYYSEDPLLSGVMGAAITRGIQSAEGVGAVIKHFACNNKEENRFASNSILSERALREIYLRGFEIAVKTSQPMCIMTSYNMINGVKSANNYELCTIAARNEWDFRGIFMTDWTATSEGKASPHLCADAGIDLIMPGSQFDIDDICAALENGALSEEKARACAARMIMLSLQTNRMENAPSYGEQFHLEPYLSVLEM